MRQIPTGYSNAPVLPGYNSGLPLAFPTSPMSPQSPYSSMGGNPLQQPPPDLFKMKMRSVDPGDPYGMKLHINTANGVSPADAMQKAAAEYRAMERRQRGTDEYEEDGCCCTVS